MSYVYDPVDPLDVYAISTVLDDASSMDYERANAIETVKYRVALGNEDPKAWAPAINIAATDNSAQVRHAAFFILCEAIKKDFAQDEPEELYTSFSSALNTGLRNETVTHIAARCLDIAKSIINNASDLEQVYEGLVDASHNKTFYSNFPDELVELLGSCEERMKELGLLVGGPQAPTALKDVLFKPDYDAVMAMPYTKPGQEVRVKGKILNAAGPFNEAVDYELVTSRLSCDQVAQASMGTQPALSLDEADLNGDELTF